MARRRRLVVEPVSTRPEPPVRSVVPKPAEKLSASEMTALCQLASPDRCANWDNENWNQLMTREVAAMGLPMTKGRYAHLDLSTVRGDFPYGHRWLESNDEQAALVLDGMGFHEAANFVRGNPAKVRAVGVNCKGVAIALSVNHSHGGAIIISPMGG